MLWKRTAVAPACCQKPAGRLQSGRLLSGPDLTWWFRSPHSTRMRNYKHPSPRPASAGSAREQEFHSFKLD